jgi:DNA-directed RNA polymerase delta subunit
METGIALRHKLTFDLPSSISDVLRPSAIRLATDELLKTLDERSRRVIVRRFGLDGQEPKTLHSIGQDEGVTRERIRQIEQVVLKNFKSEKNNIVGLSGVKSVQAALSQALIYLGGVAREEMLGQLLGLKNKTESAALGFLLNCMADVREIRETNRWKKYFRSQKHVEVESVIETARTILNEQKALCADKDFFGKIRKRLGKDIEDHVLYSVLIIAHDLVRTTFGEWGIKGWVEATPRGVGDKAYVVLKRKKEPLHFSKITELINEADFDNRKAHHQTVHNELIRDERFILVGRGTYALREWGYQSGTVGDVLERIMKTNSQAMLKEDLIDAVLKERMVKRNTILLALQNRKRFMRDESGKYLLLQSNQKEKQEEKNQTQITNDGKEVNSPVGDLTSTIVAEDQTGGAG